MASIHSEDNDTFQVKRDDGSVSDPIAKAGMPELYQSLSSAPAPAGIGSPTPPLELSPSVPAPSSISTPPVGVGAASDNQVATSNGAWSAIPPTVSAEQNAMNGVAKPFVEPSPFTLPMKKLEKTTTQTKGTSGAAQKQVDATTKALVDKMRAEAQVQTATKELESELLNTKTTDLFLHNQDVTRKEQMRQTETAKRQKAADTLMEKYNSASIDPKNLWGDEGTGNRMLAAIGIALGAVGQALTGKENGAIGIVNSAIQRDIDIQKSNIDKMGKQSDQARGALADFRNTLGDDRAAESAEWERQLGWYASRLDMIKASNASDEIKARVEKELSQVQAEIAQKRAEREQITTEKVIEDQTSKPLDMAPTEIQRDVAASEGAANALIEFGQQLEATNFAGIGPLEGRVAPIARWLGINDPKDALNQATVQKILGEKIKALSGAASSEQEAARIATTLFQKTDNEETFKALLKAEIASFSQKAATIRRQWQGKQGLINSTLKDQNDYGFKPK